MARNANKQLNATRTRSRVTGKAVRPVARPAARPVARKSTRTLHQDGINLEALWEHHHAQWRHPGQIASQWQQAADVDPELLGFTVRGAWWEVLQSLDVTLLVSREYEHLLIGMSATAKGPNISFMSMPHPSGLAFDSKRGQLHVASTRLPNQIYSLSPVNGITERLDIKSTKAPNRPLIPVRSQFLPGCMYIHDLAMINDKLYVNAVGQNAIAAIEPSQPDGYKRVWWPRCIETKNGPIFGQNHLQLNSIAAGKTLEESFFSASTDKISKRRPGHKNFPVDGRGVIFSGKTREPIAGGLTRPHSARLINKKVFVDNSGYGELGYIDDGQFEPVIKLPGWTRGLCYKDGIAFVGTSRVIPRFRNYAPGLDVDSSICGVHAINLKTGKVLGSIIWPLGNQIFAIDWVPRSFSGGFPFTYDSTRVREADKALFYAFSTGILRGE